MNNNNNNNVISNIDENDQHTIQVGAPLPDYRSASSISLQTVAPALGVSSQQYGAVQPDYLDYDPKGRGIIVTMFANAGMSYVLGISSGGIYGFRQGLTATPSTRFRVQLNSILNHSGRYGSKVGNTAGVFAILYSIYEGIADNYEFENYLGFKYTNYPMLSSMISPAFGATAASATYFAPAGIRVATLAGTIGFTFVASTYGIYTALGIPYGSRGFLFF